MPTVQREAKALFKRLRQMSGINRDQAEAMQAAKCDEAIFAMAPKGTEARHYGAYNVLRGRRRLRECVARHTACKRLMTLVFEWASAHKLIGERDRPYQIPLPARVAKVIEERNQLQHNVNDCGEILAIIENFVVRNGGESGTPSDIPRRLAALFNKTLRAAVIEGRARVEEGTGPGDGLKVSFADVYKRVAVPDHPFRRELKALRADIGELLEDTPAAANKIPNHGISENTARSHDTRNREACTAVKAVHADDSKGGIAAVFGKWPGDETDQEIADMIAEGSPPPQEEPEELILVNRVAGGVTFVGASKQVRSGFPLDAAAGTHKYSYYFMPIQSPITADEIRAALYPPPGFGGNYI
jgi:hypothetical protein